MSEVICIVKCEYSLGSLVNYSSVENKPPYHQFNIGDKYQLSYLQPSEEDKVMYINLTDNSSITVLKSDFVTLEQWRQLQINKIIG